MERLRLAGLLLVLAAAAAAQTGIDQHIQKAGVCARCHVISVVEWGMSLHAKQATGCIACHGASTGHVVDERNNVKPERLPHEAAIAGLCADCHKSGCPKTRQTAGCQSCHHVHALVNPKAQAKAPDGGSPDRAARQARFDQSAKQGEQLLSAGKWSEARAAFRAALEQKPGDPTATARLKLCEHRLNPAMPGFEAAGSRLDPQTGLPSEVRIAGLGTVMVLVPGGEAEIGAERYKNAVPVHTVRVAPFYLGKFEVTQAEWTGVMGANPSAHQGNPRLPVEQVSWEDARAFISKVNQRVPGGAFRLPTEAEWESAARAGGEDRNAAFDLKESRPVDAGQPDRLGLYGMRGNVWEWCSSLARAYPYDAADGREADGASGLRILRGGGYAEPADWYDSGARHGERPDRRLRWNGLRLARSIP